MSILTALPASCKMTDRPSAALVKDLKQRGLLDTTVVAWGGELGLAGAAHRAARGLGLGCGSNHPSNGLCGKGLSRCQEQVAARR